MPWGKDDRTTIITGTIIITGAIITGTGTAGIDTATKENGNTITVVGLTVLNDSGKECAGISLSHMALRVPRQ